jgi:mannose-1-phosphate guanylyltransferase
MKTIPVVLAGGIGERFWPLSRSWRPKQLLPIISDKPMLHETLLRIKPLCRGTVPLVVTSKDLLRKLRKVLPGGLAYEAIGEPQGKNTAPAVAIAAAWVKKRFGDAVMAIMPADHAIAPQRAFLSAVRFAAGIADKQESLVVFGVQPSRPDTGYGYIHVGESAGEHDGNVSYAVRRFVEKPDAPTAQRFVESGEYLWNSGMFVWKASAILREFEQHMPDLYRQAEEAARRGLTEKAIGKFYRECVKESIDFGIMEKSRRVMLVRGTFGWDDVGSWDALTRLHRQSESGATLVGTHIYEQDCRGTIIMNNAPVTVAAVGLRDAVLVVAGDAVLAIARERLPDLKKQLAAMKSRRDIDPSLF